MVDWDRPDNRLRLVGIVLFLVSVAGMVYQTTIGPDWLFLPVMAGLGLSFVAFLYASVLWKRRVLDAES